MKRLTLAQTISDYASCPPDRLMPDLLARLTHTPRCPVTRYLLGCQCFDRGRSATAVRHMMVAHHAEPDLQSAALLVFAGLHWVSRRGEALLPVLLETWERFGRPRFDRLPRERMLLDAFAEPEAGLQLVSPLARCLWRVPIRTLRAQIREAILSREAGLYQLLTATT